MGASPQVVDWDEDGDNDLLVGDSEGYVHYYENIGSSSVPQLTDRGRLQNGSGLLTVNSLAMPVVHDWDEDGRKDLVIGSDYSSIMIFLNVGTSDAPLFDGSTTITTNPEITQIKVSPDIGDLNGDGLKDLAFGWWQGTIVYYPNSGTNDAPVFNEVHELTADDVIVDPGGWTHLEMNDWDEDGDLDLLFGEWNGEIYLHLNLSSAATSVGRLVTGPGPGDDNPTTVCIFPLEQDAEPLVEFPAYGTPRFGVNVSAGNVIGDPADEIITGPGPGEVYGPHVRGFAVDGTPLPHLSFFAYGTNKYGVNVATGDIDGDGYDEIITGAGPGAVFGPHVRAFDYDNSSGVTPVSGVNYFAYGTPKWGANVSAGDIDGDGYDEIITGPGPGAVYGPHVRGWNVDGGAATAISNLSFFAYGTLKFGVAVGCGDLDGDGMAELVTGAGPGAVFGAHVRGWNYDGTSVTPISGINFFAWDPEVARYGVKLWAGVDLDGDGRDDLVVGAGPDETVMDGPVRVYRYQGTELTEWFSLDAYPGLTHGSCVAAGHF